MDEIYNNLLMIAFPTKYSSSIFALKYRITPHKVSSEESQLLERMLYVIPEYK